MEMLVANKFFVISVVRKIFDSNFLCTSVTI